MRSRRLHAILSLAFLLLPLHAKAVDQTKIRQWNSVTLKDGTMRTWTGITRIHEEGFSYMTATGGGSVKFADLPEETQKEIGYTPPAPSTSNPQVPASVQDSVTASASAVATLDAAIKQNSLDQQNARAKIAQIRAEMANALAMNSQAGTKTYEQKILREENAIKLKSQQARILQEQKNSVNIQASAPQATGDAPLDAAARNAVQTKLALARLRIKKEEILLEILRTELNQTGSAEGYQNKLAYIERDISVRQAEVQAADAALQAARTAAQTR